MVVAEAALRLAKRSRKWSSRERHLKHDYLMKVADKIYPQGRVKHMQSVIYSNEGQSSAEDLIIAAVDEVVDNNHTAPAQSHGSEKDQTLRKVVTLISHLTRFLISEQPLEESPLHYLEDR